MASIGETFHEARKCKGVSEEVAAKAIRIKIERLRDLEENRYENFPAHVYVRSFLRHYAEYLGIDSQPILRQFAEEHPAPPQKSIFDIVEEQPFHSPIQRHIPSSGGAFTLTSTGKAVLWANLVILLIVAACLWWIYRASPVPPANGKPPATDAAASPSKTKGSADDNWETPLSPSFSSSTNNPPMRLGPQ